MKRRNFIKSTSVLSAGALILPNSIFAKTSGLQKKVRLGFFGVGFRGQNHFNELL